MVDWIGEGIKYQKDYNKMVTQIQELECLVEEDEGVVEADDY